ncbi:hypothetical protein P255_02993 [Acinetobacter brisouii CIP 110357]|uniref:DUF4394 domain-containing protein n=1 Tax=Acinetobacter brisouii CIP 110357 TaxID=1341683 RepID=V2UG65_9GAMM|nr:hypothetical protein [Acinetobacter brisouii]ENV46174.1 hypothetical protein F954_02809 [Acinetobacter brisouii ANC 4119]ESK47511.1 hypothetical protein P255_02993 [Acinetobacter brisouii CIP 110357]
MNYPSLGAGLAMLAAFSAYIDQGSANATLVFYSDSKPSSIDTAADSSKALVTLTLPKPSLKQTNTDSINLQPTDTALVTTAGLATWARLYNGNGLAIMDFTVGSDITLLNNNLAEGSAVNLTSLKLKPYLGAE